MKIVKIDKYLIINVRSGKERLVASMPRSVGVYEVAVRIKATVKIPDFLPVIDLGEITIPELEATAEAQMG